MASKLLTAILEYISVPPVMIHTSMEKLASKPAIPLPLEATFPMPDFTRAINDENCRRFPQIIAHRGYKAKYPENTMKAFVKAVNVGSHALETDVHLTKDGVVVLSHDQTLERCFGKKDKIIDCNWEYISQFQTIQEPKQHMPRLDDLLHYLKEPGLEKIWVLLDIKMDNDPEDVIRLIAETINRVPPLDGHPWNERLVLGCWAKKYLPLCATHLPNFPITHIGFSTSYTTHFLPSKSKFQNESQNISFNIFQPILAGPFFGSSFLQKAKFFNRPVYAWTVNRESRMRWCVRNGIDDVCTDDPGLFAEVCRGVVGEEEGDVGLREWVEFLRIELFSVVYGILIRVRYGGSLGWEGLGIGKGKEGVVKRD